MALWCRSIRQIVLGSANSGELGGAFMQFCKDFATTIGGATLLYCSPLLTEVTMVSLFAPKLDPHLNSYANRPDSLLPHPIPLLNMTSGWVSEA